MCNISPLLLYNLPASDILYRNLDPGMFRDLAELRIHLTVNMGIQCDVMDQYSKQGQLY